MSTKQIKKELINKLNEATTKKDLQRICFNGLVQSMEKASFESKQNCITELCDALDCGFDCDWEED